MDSRADNVEVVIGEAASGRSRVWRSVDSGLRGQMKSIVAAGGLRKRTYVRYSEASISGLLAAGCTISLAGCSRDAVYW